MWWAIYITIILGHHHTTVSPPQVFATLGACEQFIEDNAVATPPKKKSIIKIRCNRALRGEE